MENENQEGNTQEGESTEGTEQGAAASSTEGASAESDASKEGENSEGQDDLSKEFVKDNEGNEYIPKKAFDKRIAALTAKNKEAEEYVESLRNNPEVRAQFLKEIEGKSEAAKDESESPEGETSKAPGWTNLSNWINKLSKNPEHRAFYTEQMSALINDLNPILEHVVQSRLDKALAPYKKFVGETAVKSFSSENKDFLKYEQAVYKKMKESGMSLEDAYAVVRSKDLEKEVAALKAGKTPGSPTQKSREQLNRTPITKRAPNSIGKTKPGFASLDDAIADSMRELNMGK